MLKTTHLELISYALVYFALSRAELSQFGSLFSCIQAFKGCSDFGLTSQVKRVNCSHIGIFYSIHRLDNDGYVAKYNNVIGNWLSYKPIRFFHWDLVSLSLFPSLTNSPLRHTL